MHYPIAQDACAKLYQPHRDDNGVGEDAFHDRREIEWRVCFAGRRIAGIEIRMTRLAGSVAQNEQINDHPEQENERGYEKDEPVVGLLGVHPLREIHDRLTPVECEVESERNENAKDPAKHAPLPHMEPCRVDLHNGNSAKALKVHVDGIRK